MDFKMRYPILSDCLWRCANAEAPELWSTLRKLYAEGRPSKAFYEALRAEISKAIIISDISPEEYASVTQDEDYPTHHAVQERLRELWLELYDEPPPDMP